MVPDDWQLKVDHPDLASLTEWAVEARYPGDWPEAVETDARSAAKQARSVWESMYHDLVGHGISIEDVA